MSRGYKGGMQKPVLELLFLMCCLNDDDTCEDYFLCGMCLCVSVCIYGHSRLY